MNRIIQLFILGLVSCNTLPNAEQQDRWKEEVRETEAAFAAMADSLGIAAAFEYFADEKAVLMRGNKIISGRDSIAMLYSKQPQDIKLVWSPDFIDVSQSGDLAYTYGKFKATLFDSLGNELTNEGIFHTVWKRQVDGSWRYVWD